MKRAYYFIAQPLHTICVQFQYVVRSDIYDGPGTRSKVIKIAEEPGKVISFCFTRYLGYLELFENFTTKDKTNISWFVQRNTSLIHRYGPLSPPLFFFLMGIIGKGKMCRN